MKEFHENQIKAITHGEKPMFVLAGPGSGKTTVIIHRVKYLLEVKKISPKKITVITFTKATVTEMKARFAALCVPGGTGVTFATFHSLFFRILRGTYHYTLEQLINEDEKWKVLRSLFRENEIDTEDEDESIRDFLSDYSLMKNELSNPYGYEPNHTNPNVFRVICGQYEAFKERQGKLDFDDMLTQCYELLSHEPTTLAFWQNQLQYLLIDEFQDINKAQYECVKMLALPENNLFIVGDDDQSIYGFRGARPEFLLHFPRDYPDAAQTVLDINYRSTGKIIALSTKIIAANKQRFTKNMKGVHGDGHKSVFFSAEDSADEVEKIIDKIHQLLKEGIPYHEIAIIYRTNIQGGSFARLLADKGIPYEMKDTGINIYRHFIAQDLLAYLSLVLHGEDDESAKRIINRPKRYISKELLADAQRMQRPLLDALSCCSGLKKWQAERLENLKINIKHMKKMKPYEALKYIREVIAYDDYLQDYAAFRRANLQGYFEIADELVYAAKGLETIEDYFERIRTLNEEMSRQKQNQGKVTESAVVLSTMHSAKGLEFEAVFIPSIVEGLIPHEKSETPEELEEERRLFYVAATRAKRRLFLSVVEKRHDKEVERSRFLKELGLK